MLNRVLLVTVLALSFDLTLPVFSAPDELKTSTERAITEPLEIWGNIRNSAGAEPSLEYLEKMAVDFDKINNPLCAAAAEGNMKEMGFLLRDGVSPDSTDSLGISALSHALLANNKEAFSLLMAAGASSNQKGPFGVTPLMLAANSNLTEMVSLLLLNGANPKLKNDDGETAFSIAQRKNLHEVLILLAPPKQLIPKPDPPPIITAPLPPLVNTAIEMSAQNAPPLPADKKDIAQAPKQTPEARKKMNPTIAFQDQELLKSTTQGLTETVERLIQNGANPNVKTQNRLSPLTIAVSRNDLTTTEVLLQHKADPNTRSEFDMTPLMIAVQNNNPPMIRRLLRSGANPRHENIAGQSACDLGLASPEVSIRNLFKDCL